ncbi:MAG TPA: DUF3515 domain-containing protein [Actinomycetes bacterium]|nr:DUF3515 domain-containing protein [Actinomycetes bacterium]
MLVTSCSGTAQVSPPEPATNTDPCADLMNSLPVSLVDQSMRETDPPSPLTAAWGDPPITIRCGVPDPDALTPAAQLYSVSGVDWFPEELTQGYVFTTYGRTTNVEVTVPDDYEPEISAVTELSALVAETIPRSPKR